MKIPVQSLCANSGGGIKKFACFKLTLCALLVCAGSHAWALNPLVPKALLSDPVHDLPVTVGQNFGPSAVVVRGVPIEVPFSLRIFIKEIASFSNTAAKGISISGFNLTDQLGRSIGKEATLNCSIYRNPLVLLMDSPVEKFPNWICRSKNYQTMLMNNKLEIKPEGGFIAVGDSLYRGKLEVIQNGDKLELVNEVGAEPYLAGLVNKEMHSSFPQEAVKAQIIAARSYALATAADRRRLGFNFDLYGTEADQVYSGSEAEDAKASRLVKEVRGQVLMHQENVLKAYYHSSSGGYSELPQNVWGKAETEQDNFAYSARSSPVDSSLEAAEWSIKVSPKLGLAWKDIGEIQNIKVLSRSEGKRVLSMRLEGARTHKVISGTEFRRRMGLRIVKSTYFTVQKVDGGWLIEGRGWGHGVGLSQLGAKAMAEKGLKADEILRFYYPFASLRKLTLDTERKPASLPQEPKAASSLLPINAR